MLQNIQFRRRPGVSWLPEGLWVSESFCLIDWRKCQASGLSSSCSRVFVSVVYWWQCLPALQLSLCTFAKLNIYSEAVGLIFFTGYWILSFIKHIWKKKKSPRKSTSNDTTFEIRFVYTPLYLKYNLYNYWQTSILEQSTTGWMQRFLIDKKIYFNKETWMIHNNVSEYNVDIFQIMFLAAAFSYSCKR